MRDEYAKDMYKPEILALDLIVSDRQLGWKPPYLRTNP